MPSHHPTAPRTTLSPRGLRIGDAAKVLGLEPYVLRYWETEFSQLTPERTNKGQRQYSDADLDLLRRIQKLLHDEGLTIEGARRRLEQESHLRELTESITRELLAIRTVLATPAKTRSGQPRPE
jgi:DNA-binding transcriptional MerR regulator